MKFEDVIKEKHGVWDPMLELTYNSPYLTINSVISAGKLRPAMGARNQVQCCKSSERFGLKCEFSLVPNKYIPYIGLV
jgi:hypothetical protein